MVDEKENTNNTKCGKECEVFSRVVGYHRPIKNWNRGKQEEFKDRKVYNIEDEEKWIKTIKPKE
jgi:ribonucleoside-triphosphate reductase